ncbi:unnamed protein product [Clonostachys rosea]|uniref:Uncharacterized protein n=1 Tax=Bionectria ochroleuca TaxID=29856 RepID=A0ABY6UD66_BIOOC|nr:unnamed protein product [Clonostachys rosea]
MSVQLKVGERNLKLLSALDAIAILERRYFRSVWEEHSPDPYFEFAVNSTFVVYSSVMSQTSEGGTSDEIFLKDTLSDEQGAPLAAKRGRVFGSLAAWY